MIVLRDYFQKGYHGERHHADYGELVVLMLTYKAHQLGANAVLKVAVTLPLPNESYSHVASGDAAITENVVK